MNNRNILQSATGKNPSERMVRWRPPLDMPKHKEDVDGNFEQEGLVVSIFAEENDQTSLEQERNGMNLRRDDNKVK